MSMFWSDAQQASERLLHTFILYEDEPVYVENIAADGDRDAVASLRRYSPKEGRFSANLSDPRFHKFRKLPAKGWINAERQAAAYYVERRPVRSRTHGLNGNNTSVAYVRPDGNVTWRDIAFEDIARDPGYAAACKNEYPSFRDIYDHVRNGSCIGINPSFAMFRDDAGLRWLYKGVRKIALIPNNDTLLITEKFSYLKEEIMGVESLPVSSIRDL